MHHEVTKNLLNESAPGKKGIIIIGAIAAAVFFAVTYFSCFQVKSACITGIYSAPAHLLQGLLF